MSFRFVSEETFNTLRSPVLGAVSISGHCNPISAPRYLYNQTSRECFSSAADKQLSLSTNPSSMHALCKNRRRKDFVSHFLRETQFAFILSPNTKSVLLQWASSHDYCQLWAKVLVLEDLMIKGLHDAYRQECSQHLCSSWRSLDSYMGLSICFL